MTVAPEQDAPQAPAAPPPGFCDALTFAFGDPVARLYGHARIHLGGDSASAFALLFSGSEVAASSTAGAQPLADGVPGSWEGLRVGGLRTSVEEPLATWTLGFEREGSGFDLRFEARCAPAVLDAEAETARTSGMEGYEQLCSVAGTVTIAGRERQVRCLGQRGHAWGIADPKRVELARTLSAWLGADRALMLTATRPARARGHGEEAVAAWLVDGGEPHAIDDARLTTAYDGALRQQRAGLELWVDEASEFARRASGKVLCGTTIDLGDQRLDSAFFAWRMEGREGVGRYDIVRRAPARKR